jgi:FtsP/CotA-like multicopper oxidase with cupredoxin domain
MFNRKFLNLLVSLMVLTSLLFGGSAHATAMPSGPTDESKVPHYFGPYPNWANSPLTMPDAQVVITGDGTGAEAVASVGANGTVTNITITNPGHNYSNAKVDILGSGTGAKADATIVKKGSVVAVTVDTNGSGYTAPMVSFASNGSGGGASATAYGGVDAVTLVDGGSGYTFPTVEFDLPDGADGVQATGHAEMDGNGTITAVIVDNPGSGYSFAPGIAIHNGTLFDPIAGASLAQATTTLTIMSVVMDTFGADYNSPPLVSIGDPTGTGATATAVLDNGIISAITLKDGGSGYITPGGIRKFVDTLPGLGASAANNLGQYIPVAVPDQNTFPGADYYEIAVVQYTEKMHSDLPATTLRGYVQLETSVVTGKHYTLPGGKFGVDQPHYLGPTIVAQKNRPVRITFYNLLPKGAEGDLFMPVDSTIMGSGEAEMEMPYNPVPAVGGDVMDAARNPMCNEKYSDPAMRAMCFTENRATLHLHGGNVPWISDGTPHQWITPAGESTNWPEGVSVQSVPDMVGASRPAGVPDCSGSNDGCQTFYYTNQQSARLMFYHDHSWGITRLNVYAGEAAGYLIQDPTEQSLVSRGIIPADQIPLVIQDRTFVPDAAQLALQDPTWDTARWGTKGNFWYHHVYMPAQNPGDPSGMSAYGRWMYGPWFWPPAGDVKNGPIANPYYIPSCNLDDPLTWQYQTDPFCEPEFIPGTPNLSVGMEQFNDTPIVNGTAYPTVTLQPKSYRFRVLNAANDRFFNFQWYVADATTASTGLNSLGQVIGGTEVALKASELAAAQLDPVVFPTPDLNLSPAGPDWIQIGTEGGFLPKPVVVGGQQVTTWITDPTRFDVGNVDLHSLLLAPAERADVIVDFSRFAGKTLILYNDAPAAFPARVPSYDYYTGAPDLSPVGAPTILPGYGPNTRTIMQVKIAGTAAPAFNMTNLNTAFTHKANGSGVFESGQHPIIVGQAAYNSAYGTSFAASGWCSSPTSTRKCDGYARINQQGGDLFTFDTLKGATNGTWSKLSLPLEPKAIHDEMNSTNFDEYGRMQATLGVEVVPATPGLQNVVLSPYVFPTTELIDTTNLPKAATFDANTNQFTDLKVTPIATADDGTQIWKITHNGVDTHPIHFHATDVQVINRVTWDNIVIPPVATELGWKETVRVSPLEDTIVAMRPAIPALPFDFPNSIRLLSPMMADGAAIDLSSLKDGLGLGMSAFAPNGEPIDVYNHFVNFGAEYVYHCHILSHEEMDMMHSVLYAFPPVAPSGLAFNAGTLSWTDNSRSETAFVVEKSQDGISWTAVGRVDRQLSPTAGISTGGTETFADSHWTQGDQYRVVAQNTVGDTWDYSDPGFNEILPGTYAFPVVTTEVVSEVLNTTPPPAPPAAPSNLTATVDVAPQVSLAWLDNATDETGFLVQRSTDGVSFTDLTTLPANSMSYVDTAVTAGMTYTYQVAAFNLGGASAFSNTASAIIPGPQAPAAPSELAANLQDTPLIDLAWLDNSADETSFVIQRSTDGVNFSALTTVGANVTTYNDLAVFGGITYTYRVAAVNVNGTSAYAVSNSLLVPPDATPPAAPSNLAATSVTATSLRLNWQDNSNNETGFVIQIATNSTFTKNLVTITAGPNVTFADITALKRNTKYFFRVQAVNGFNGGAGPFPWSPTLNVTTPR